MKDTIFYILIILLLGCCQDDDSNFTPKEIDCQENDCFIDDEFYASGLLNGDCWTSPFVGINPLSSSDVNILIGDPEINGIRGSLSLIFEKSTTNLKDTIWLGRQVNSNAPSNSGTARYTYFEGHAIAGSFRFDSDASFTDTDYLIIDSYNTDTSIIVGRFQLRFTEREIPNFVTQAPDSMYIKCGSFRVEKF